jgi:hypothetical protein
MHHGSAWRHLWRQQHLILSGNSLSHRVNPSDVWLPAIAPSALGLPLTALLGSFLQSLQIVPTSLCLSLVETNWLATSQVFFLSSPQEIPNGSSITILKLDDNHFGVGG